MTNQQAAEAKARCAEATDHAFGECQTKWNNCYLCSECEVADALIMLERAMKYVAQVGEPQCPCEGCDALTVERDALLREWEDGSE